MVYGVLFMTLNRLYNSAVAFIFSALLSAVVVATHAEAGPYRDYAMGLNLHPPKGASFRPDLEEQLVALANAYRAEEGKEALKADPSFQIAARAHAADMMINGFMGHSSSTGLGFDSRMRVFVDDITKYPSLAENAARDTQKTPVGSGKARALFQQWVESRPHRKALLNRSYRYVSTGVIQKGNSIWAVQIFFGEPRKQGLFFSN
jgi:uncharacterized protein YkwD